MMCAVCMYIVVISTYIAHLEFQRDQLTSRKDYLKDKMTADGVTVSHEQVASPRGARVSVTSPRVAVGYHVHDGGVGSSHPNAGYGSGYQTAATTTNNTNNNANTNSYGGYHQYDNSYSAYPASPPAASDRLPIIPGQRRRADST